MGKMTIYQKLKVKVQLVREAQNIPEIKINAPDDIYSMLNNEVQDWDRERFLSIMLNSRNQIIGIEEVSVGSLNSAVVHPREIFKSAILANAVSIILVHNHPSGHATPSDEDTKITKQIRQAAEILNISLLDHIIIGKNGYISILDEHWPTKITIHQ